MKSYSSCPRALLAGLLILSSTASLNRARADEAPVGPAASDARAQLAQATSPSSSTAAPSPGGAGTASPPAPEFAPAARQKQFDDAVALYREKRFHKASTALFELLQHAIPAAMSAEARYYLGQSLESIGLPVMAGLMYRDVIRFGPSAGTAYPQALTAWANLSVRLDDLADLGDRLRGLPASSDPANVPALRYLRGSIAFDRRQLEPARAALEEAAASDTLIGWQARYTLALNTIAAGDREAAFKMLEPLTRGPVKAGELKGTEAQVAGRLRDLSMMGQARIRYAQGHFDEASSLYAKVEPSSSYSSRARYEEAWVDFWRDRPLEAIGRLATLRLDRPGAHFVPEAELLAAMFYIRTNQHDLADGVLRVWLDRIYPLRVALRDFTNAHRGRAEVAEVTRRILGVVPVVGAAGQGAERGAENARDPALEESMGRAIETLRPIIDEMRRDREVEQALTGAARAEIERQAYGKQPSWWRGTALGQAVVPALAREEQRSIDAAGMRLQTQLMHYRMWLAELNVMGLGLRREVTIQRLARANNQPDPDPYAGEPLPPFDFVRP